MSAPLGRLPPVRPPTHAHPPLNSSSRAFDLFSYVSLLRHACCTEVLDKSESQNEPQRLPITPSPREAPPSNACPPPPLSSSSRDLDPSIVGFYELCVLLDRGQRWTERRVEAREVSLEFNMYVGRPPCECGERALGLPVGAVGERLEVARRWKGGPHSEDGEPEASHTTISQPRLTILPRAEASCCS
jgi:hypothetical protein